MFKKLKTWHWIVLFVAAFLALQYVNYTDMKNTDLQEMRENNGLCVTLKCKSNSLEYGYESPEQKAKREDESARYEREVAERLELQARREKAKDLAREITQKLCDTLGEKYVDIERSTCERRPIQTASK